MSWVRVPASSFFITSTVFVVFVLDMASPGYASFALIPNVRLYIATLTTDIRSVRKNLTHSESSLSKNIQRIRIGKYANHKYGKYNIHHTGVGYRHLGHEELGKDVLPLCPFAHWLIHGGNMKAKAPWQPNIIQKALHLWCSFPLIIKQLFLLFISLLIFLIFFYTNIIF